MSKKRSYGVGIAPPSNIPSLSEAEWRSMKVQVEMVHLPFRSVADLVTVLERARKEPGVEAAVVVKLTQWSAERERINVEKLSQASLSTEERLYVMAIAPCWASIQLRDAADLALIIKALVDQKLIKMAEADPEGFCVQGELKRIDFIKSSARGKLR